MKGIIDRFEGDIVVVEIMGETQDYPKSIFPKGVKVGDFVSIEGEKVVILKEDTKKQQKEIQDLMDDLFE